MRMSHVTHLNQHVTGEPLAQLFSRVAACCSVLQCVCNTLRASLAAVLACCSVMQHAVCCSVLQRVAAGYSVLHCIAVWCETLALQHTAAHCNTLQHTATHCNTLQHAAHTATHCNTLQHTATHFVNEPCHTRERVMSLNIPKKNKKMLLALLF